MNASHCSKKMVNSYKKISCCSFLISQYILMLLFCVTSSYIYNTDDVNNPQRMWDPEKGFIMGQDVRHWSYKNITLRNQTVQFGTTSFLHCKVRNMADKKISWIRRRDNHILTSGLLTYSSDDRFSVVRDEDTDDWALQIKYIQNRDRGKYECQVSTKTGRYGYMINLRVMVPKAIIVGPGELHVQSGSTISLLCVIEKTIVQPQYIFWYRNKKMINYEKSRGGIVVETNHLPKPKSRLTITNAKYNDSGNYSCFASSTNAASVNVFVSEGDKPAAIQRLGSSCSPPTALSPAFAVQISLLFLVSVLSVYHISVVSYNNHIYLRTHRT